MQKDDCQEFRPLQVIDYQNRTKNQPSFGDRTSAMGNISSNQQKFIDNFPRKIIEYDHKTKIHSWNWFCPVIQIEYNHSKSGFSLHEHPPPKPSMKEETEQPHWIQNEPKDEYKQLRQSKIPWAQQAPIDRQQALIDRQERFPHGPQSQHHHQHFQPRYENRQTIPPNTQTAHEMYYRRSPQERNWAKNTREWSATYDR